MAPECQTSAILPINFISAKTKQIQSDLTIDFALLHLSSISIIKVGVFSAMVMVMFVQSQSQTQPPM